MIATFLYLTWCGFVNRLRRRLRRLREPRYLIGAIVGGLYVYSFFLRRVGRPGGVMGLGAIAPYLTRFEFMATVGLFAVVALAWLWPATSKGIAFSPAEVQFLFTAPITRRQLLRYKLLKSVVGSFFASLVLALILRPGTLVSDWRLLTGVWIVFALLSLHFTGVSLSRASLLQHGATGLRRQWLPLAVVVSAVAILAATVVVNTASLSALPTPGAVLDGLSDLARRGAPYWVLWPFHEGVSLVFASTVADYGRALSAVVVIGWLNYLWVMRSDAAFEEASAALAERVASGIGKPRRVTLTSRLSPFDLGATGRPEVAILWKNLVLVGRFASVRTLIRVAVLLVVAGLVVGKSRAGTVDALAALAAVAIAMTVLVGPQLLRNDLRQDLERLSVLKTWPLSGATIVAGELLAPAAVLTAVAWVCSLAVAVVLDRLIPGVTAGERLAALVAAMVLSPAVILLQLLVQNAIAVFFPAWVAIGSARATGVDAMGQRMILVFGIWLALIVGILPAGLLAVVVGGVIFLTTHAVPIALPAIAAAAAVLVEVAVGIQFVGAALDRTDVGAIDGLS